MTNSINIPKLIIMCGLSGSGKSAIATQLAQQYNAEIVSYDKIRKELTFCGNLSKNEKVFQIFIKKIRRFLINGINVIADATNISMKSRRVIFDNLEKINCYKICYIVPKRLEDCLRDNRMREYPVPDEVIQKQVRGFQIPFMEEGFDEIIIHDFHYESQISKYIDKMRGFDQKNPHYKFPLDEHCRNVNKKFKEIYENESFEKYSIGLIYHDIGKPFCQTIDEDDIAHYYGHAEYGSYILLTNSISRTLDDCFLINYHRFPFDWKNKKTHEKYKKIFGEEKYKILIMFHECDVEN